VLWGGKLICGRLHVSGCGVEIVLARLNEKFQSVSRCTGKKKRKKRGKEKIRTENPQKRANPKICNLQKRNKYATNHNF